MNKSFSRHEVNWLFGFWAILCSFITVACLNSLAIENPLIRVEGERLKLIDFVYYIFITKAFWGTGPHSVYSLPSQYQIFATETGVSLSSMMTMNILPPGLIVLAPFALSFSYLGMPFAYALWIGVSFATLAVSLLFLFCSQIKLGKDVSVFPVLGIGVSIFSNSTKVALMLGQTSVLFCALVVYLLASCEASVCKPDSQFSWLRVIALFVLGSKPQFFVIGLLIILASGRWREISAAFLLVALVAIALTPYLGLDWPILYKNALSIYGFGGRAPQYEGAVVPELMNTFRSAFSKSIGDEAASRLSFAVIALCFSFVGVRGLSSIYGASSASCANSSFARDITTLAGSYLLFSPHSGLYEELFILVSFAALFVVGKPSKGSCFFKATILLMAVVTLNRFYISEELLPGVVRPYEYWLIKALLVAGIFLISLREVSICKPEHSGTRSQVR